LSIGRPFVEAAIVPSPALDFVIHVLLPIHSGWVLSRLEVTADADEACSGELTTFCHQEGKYSVATDIVKPFSADRKSKIITSLRGGRKRYGEV
jgi:hypothetical protein